MPRCHEVRLALLVTIHGIREPRPAGDFAGAPCLRRRRRSRQRDYSGPDLGLGTILGSLHVRSPSRRHRHRPRPSVARTRGHRGRLRATGLGPRQTVVKAAKRAAPMDDTKEASNKPLRIKGTKVKVPSSYQGRARTGPRARLLGETPPVGTVRQWLGRDQVTGTLYRKDYTLRGVGEQDRGLGRQRHRRSRPATAATRSPNTDHGHRCAGGRPGRASSTATSIPMETEAFSTPPDRDGTNAHARAGRQRQRRRLHRRRRQDRRADRQRPRRQLLRLPGQHDLHRGVPLLAVQRAVRPQRDDDRRVRLGRTAPAPTRRTSRPATCAPAARLGRSSTRARSPTSGSTCCTTTPTRSRRPG